VHVSGGEDYGFFAYTETCTCHSCGEVVDVLIGHMQIKGPIGDPEYDKHLNKCPECASNDVEPWPNNHPCPKCKESMVNMGSVANWD